MQCIVTHRGHRILWWILFGYLCMYTTCSRDVKGPEINNRYSKPYLEIEEIRNNKPVDFVTLKSIYTENLADFIQTNDLESHIRIQEELREGLKRNNTHIQSQIVSKTIQKVFFNQLSDALIHAAKFTKDSDYKSKIAFVEESYKILRPTVLRRSEWIGKGNELDYICLHQIKILNAAKNGTAKEFVNAKNSLLKYLTYAYVLSIFYEFDGIEKNRGKDHKICEEKAVEARIFFEIIKDYAKSITLKGLSEAALSLKYTDMDIESMRRLISETFVTKIPKIP